MTLHPRHQHRQQAHADLLKALAVISEEHTLTAGEAVFILSQVLASYTKYILKCK